MSVGRFFEAGRFLSVGVANTFLGLSIIYAAKWLLHLGDAVHVEESEIELNQVDVGGGERDVTADHNSAREQAVEQVKQRDLAGSDRLHRCGRVQRACGAHQIAPNVPGTKL